MLLRMVSLIVLAASVYALGRAVEPIVDQNRKVRQWPSVDAAVTVRPAGAVQPATTMRTTTMSTMPAGARAGGATPRAESVVVTYRYGLGGVVFRNRLFAPPTADWLPADSQPGPDGEVTYTRRGYYDPASPGELF